MQAKKKTNRRQFLRYTGFTLATLALSSPWQQLTANTAERSLSLYHTHTGEKLRVTYFTDGHYLIPELAQINHFLRDFRTGEVFPIDKQLLDLLYKLTAVTHSKGTYEIISGYRSPKTNQQLRDMGRGVARKSLHMQGKAIDIRLTDVDTVMLKKAALELKSGGVGYYAKSDFVHIDTGRVRTW